MVDYTPDMNKIIVGYSPSDFFYSSVDNPPSSEDCKTYQDDNELGRIDWETNCNESNINTYKDDCVKIELCKNSQKVKDLYDHNKWKSENHERNLNTLSIYRVEYIGMWNLGIGIVGLLIAIYYLFSKNDFVKNVGKMAGNLTEKIKESIGSKMVLGTGTGIIPATGQTSGPESKNILTKGGKSGKFYRF